MVIVIRIITTIIIITMTIEIKKAKPKSTLEHIPPWSQAEGYESPAPSVSISVSFGPCSKRYGEVGQWPCRKPKNHTAFGGMRFGQPMVLSVFAGFVDVHEGSWGFDKFWGSIWCWKNTSRRRKQTLTLKSCFTTSTKKISPRKQEVNKTYTTQPEHQWTKKKVPTTRKSLQPQQQHSLASNFFCKFLETFLHPRTGRALGAMVSIPKAL